MPYFLLFCSAHSKKSPRAKSALPNDLHGLFQPPLFSCAFFFPNLNPSFPVSIEPSIGNGSQYYYYWLTFIEHLLCTITYKVLLFVIVQNHHRKTRHKAATALKQAGPDMRIRTKFQVYFMLSLSQIRFQ